MNVHWVGWIFLLILASLNEGAAAAKGEGTFTAFWRSIRGTILGRLALWPLWVWLSWHLMIDSHGFDWIDIVTVVAGLIIGTWASVAKPQAVGRDTATTSGKHSGK